MGDNQVQEVKDRVDIVALIGTYVALEKKGRHYKGLCPFHSEKTPSFVVSPEMQIYKCFGCGKGGDVFSFLMEIEGMSFAQSLGVLAEQAGVKLVKRAKTASEELAERLFVVNEHATKLYSYLLLQHPVGETAREYLKNRGISEQTMAKFRLGYAPQKWHFLNQYLLKKGFSSNEILQAGLCLPKEGRGYYDRFRGRLMFPLIDLHEHVVGFSARVLKKEEEPKYLNSPETPVFSKSNFLYGANLARSSIVRGKSSILVEGVLDVCSLHQAGVTQAVAPMGTALTTSQLNLLSRLTGNLIFCFDGDSAGMNATKKGVLLAQQHNFEVEVLLLPLGKDPDDIVREGLIPFEQLLLQAVPVMDFFFREVATRFDLSSPQGKKKVSAELLPIIGTLSSPIERSQYLKKLADLLEIREEILREALIKENVRKDSNEELITKILTEKPESISALEEYLLSLILKSPLEKAQKILRRLGRNDFEQPVPLQVFLALKDQMLGRSYKLNLQKFVARLDLAGQELIERCYLRDLGKMETDVDLMEQELERSLQSLKNRSIKRELRQISLKIRMAELGGDESLSNQLQDQFLTLTQKLNQRR